MLRVENLNYQRNEQRLWQGVCFTLEPGNLLQISGANGSGKTSLLRVLAGLSPASSGEIYWRGVLMENQKTAYQQQLHYLGHQPVVKGELTVGENIRFSCPRSLEKNRLAAIEQAGLMEHIYHPGHQLSQGQKQRVALTRLFLSSVKLWILDEPLAGLDAEMMEKLQEIFAAHLSRDGIIMLTTHWPLTLKCPSHFLQLNRADRT